MRDFSDALLAELDYGREAANVAFFRDVFANEDGFEIPAVIQEYSRNRVLMEELVRGRKTSGVAGLSKRHRTVAARRIARFVLEPAFEHGVFYADPHPGNLLIHDDGALCVMDFGKVGRLTPDARRRLADIFVAIIRSDGQRLTDRLIELTAPSHPIDLDLMTRGIDRMLALYVDVSLEHLRLAEAIGELLRLVRRHGLRMPGTLVSFFKALAMCEGVLQTVDPDASFADYLRPMVGKLLHDAVAGPQMLGRVRDSVVDAAQLTIELPRRLDRVLGQLERGNLRVWTRIEDADPLMNHLTHLVARSNATILAAACIVGLATVMQFYRPPGWQEWIGWVFGIVVVVALVDYVRTLSTLRK